MPFSLLITARPEETELELRSHGIDDVRGIAAGVLGAWLPDRTSKFLLPFTRDVVESPRQVRAASIKDWVELIYESLRELDQNTETPWRIHCIDSGVLEEKGRLSRTVLIEEQLAILLKEKRRSWASRRISEQLPYKPGELRASIFFTSPTEGWIGVSRYPTALSNHWAPSPGGIVDISERLDLPSRAYRKLVEGCTLLGERPSAGESCVDLGASPGGWTALAAEWGATITAVDRSPLAPELMKHSRIHFVKGDAMRFSPEQPLTWLLCDVITTPDNTLAILASWLQSRWCSRFCVTLKFKGAIDGASLEAARRIVEPQCSRWLIKQLVSNKNEVAVLGSLAA